MANDTVTPAPRSRITRVPWTPPLSVFTQSTVFTPISDWMAVDGIEGIPVAKPLEGKRVSFTVRVLSDDSSSS